MQVKSPDDVAEEIVSGLSFSSNRMLNGRLVGEQYFAAEAIAGAIKFDRMRMASTITMGEVRKHAGQGRLGYDTILWAVNEILKERSEAGSTTP